MNDFDKDQERREGDGGRREDAIPDLPENQAVREFLRTAPAKGLHLPLGKEVKVMQCWRCKAYGHRYDFLLHIFSCLSFLLHIFVKNW